MKSVNRVGRAVADGGLALAGELHQVGTEVAVRQVAVPGGSRTTRNESGTSTSSLGSPGVPL